MAFSVKYYGWRPDHPDHRDLKFKAPPRLLKALPPKIDMRADFPIIFDQGNLGSCTANATCGQVWFLDKTSPVQPSRLFVYYNTRIIEGTVREDAGASIRDSIKSVVRWGFAPESDWPYNVSKFTQKPPQKAYDDAAKEKVTKYRSVFQSPSQIKAALAGKHPVNFGFTVYESFESDQVATTGIMPMPKKNEEILGGHAVLLVGYDDTKGRYIARNSWGLDWGMDGYFTMPYAFIHNSNYASDFWVVSAVP